MNKDENSESLVSAMKAFNESWGKTFREAFRDPASWHTPTSKEKKAEAVEFHDWLDYGVEKGWITDTFCNTHEGDPYMTAEEQHEWDEGGDPCMVVIKILFGQ